MTPAEPTDEQVAAFKAAWEAEDDQQIQKLAAGPYMPEPGDRTRVGLRAALNLAEPFLPSQGRQQAFAWEAVVRHPAVQPCFEERRPLLESVLALLDRYEKLDDVDQRVREHQARETAQAVLARVMNIGIPNDGAGVVRAAIRDEVADIARDFGVVLS